MVDTVVEATQAAIVEVTQAVIMVEGGTQVVITVEEDTQVAIMEDAQEVTMVTQEVTITAMATVIMAGMADGVTVTTLTPGESRSMVIRAGGGLIRTPILTTRMGMATLTPTLTATLILTPIRLSSRIILPHRR